MTPTCESWRGARRTSLLASVFSSRGMLTRTSSTPGSLHVVAQSSSAFRATASRRRRYYTALPRAFLLSLATMALFASYRMRRRSKCPPRLSLLNWRTPCRKSSPIRRCVFGFATAHYATPKPYPDRKSTRLNSSHVEISYAVFCLKKKKKKLYHYFFNKIKKKKRQNK